MFNLTSNPAGTPHAPRVGVCSWSLQPTTPEALVSSLKACDIHAVQLALDPIRSHPTGPWCLTHTKQLIESAGISLLSGMLTTVGEDYATLATIRETGGVRPTQHWQQNLHNARACFAIARELAIPLVTLHAGFVPHDQRDPEFGVMVSRLSQLAHAASTDGISLALETGQETAPALLELLHAVQATGVHVGVNFDPANMILYASGDPVAALRSLAPHVRQVHIKDAVRTNSPGEWGSEVRVGTGEVNWPEFFAVLRNECPPVNLIIEREAGTDRVADIIAARALVRNAAGL